MQIRFGLVAMLLISIVVPASSDKQGSGPSEAGIQGVWRVVEQTINARTLTGQNLGVGFHTYTNGYFVAVRESDIPPRPVVTDDSNAAQLLAAYGPFVAQFGTYRVSGDRLTSQILVAKNADNTGQTGDQQFRLDGTTLILTSPYPPAPPGARNIVLKMVRVE